MLYILLYKHFQGFSLWQPCVPKKMANLDTSLYCQHQGRHLTYFWHSPLSSDMLCCSVQLLQPCGLLPARLLCQWDFPGKNTRLGCQFLIQRLLPTQGLNLYLLHWQWYQWQRTCYSQALGRVPSIYPQPWVIYLADFLPCWKLSEAFKRKSLLTNLEEVSDG